MTLRHAQADARCWQTRLFGRFLFLFDNALRSGVVFFSLSLRGGVVINMILPITWESWLNSLNTWLLFMHG